MLHEPYSNLNQDELISKLHVKFEGDLVIDVPHGFNNSIEHVKYLNPYVKLNIEGIHFLNSILDGFVEDVDQGFNF